MKQVPVASHWLLVFFFFFPFIGIAQSDGNLSVSASALPEAPMPVQQPVQSAAPHAAASGNISGTILDTNGDVLQGATITISGFGFTRSASSGSAGQFDFANLPSGTYTIRVTASGMTAYTSSPTPLNAGQFLILPAISLSVSGGATSVTVTADKEQLAEEQVHIAVQQRVGGVIPNFYSAYEWDAPPMMAKQKYKLVARSLFDPVSFLAVAGIAGAEQYKGIFPAYGSGIEGYGKRYGAALANRVSGDLLGRAVYPAIFHQDPRYFYKGKGSVTSRMLYALSAAVMTRSDSGRWEPNYSNVLGNFSAGAISTLYYPQSDRGASLVILNGLADTGADAVSNLIREFVLKQITSHVPKGANGQP